MTHASEATGKIYEIGLIVENDTLKSYDLITIMDFSDLETGVKMIGFYYGDYGYKVTEEYIKKYYENCN